MRQIQFNFLLTVIVSALFIFSACKKDDNNNNNNNNNNVGDTTPAGQVVGTYLAYDTIVYTAGPTGCAGLENIETYIFTITKLNDNQVNISSEVTFGGAGAGGAGFTMDVANSGLFSSRFPTITKNGDNIRFYNPNNSMAPSGPCTGYRILYAVKQ